MPRDVKIPQVDPEDKVLSELVDAIRSEVARRHGAELTFEERRDAAAKVMREVLWLDEDRDLRGLVSRSEEVEVDGKRYKRLEQPSSAIYYGRWGAHSVPEPLYRQVGVRNGPTIKPLELKVGMISRHMTPDLARIVGELGALGSSREVKRWLVAVGLVPPGRAFLEKRMQELAQEISGQIDALEEAARAITPVPAEVGSLSCGMDRMAVRMAEPADPETAAPPRRTTPYQRTPPPPKEHRYRMSWSGSTTIYDREGEPLQTWRYAAEAAEDPDALARRIAADARWIALHHPGIPIHCIQDAASELKALPKALLASLPANTNAREFVDFQHLMGYLEAVVNACEPAGDPSNMKEWYRWQLLCDDTAIDRIYRKLRRIYRALPVLETAKRDALYDAISYIRTRKDKMRYASARAQRLPIGSGATEGTCGLMQQRVKRRGQSWGPPGLKGVLAIRGLALSDRWHAAWQAYAASHRFEVRGAA